MVRDYRGLSEVRKGEGEEAAGVPLWLLFKAKLEKSCSFKSLPQTYLIM